MLNNVDQVDRFTLSWRKSIFYYLECICTYEHFFFSLSFSIRLPPPTTTIITKKPRNNNNNNNHYTSLRSNFQIYICIIKSCQVFANERTNERNFQCECICHALVKYETSLVHVHTYVQNGWQLKFTRRILLDVNVLSYTLNVFFFSNNIWIWSKYKRRRVHSLSIRLV